MTNVTPEQYVNVVFLLNRYAAAVDSKNWTLLESCFTPDATADLPLTGHHEGSAAIVSAIRGLLSAVYATQHVLTNHTVEVREAEVWSTSYFQAHHKDAVGRLFTSAGTYTDRMAEVGGQWRIAHRTLRRIWTAGDESVLGRPQDVESK